MRSFLNNLLDRFFPIERKFYCIAHMTVLSELSEKVQKRFITFPYLGHLEITITGDLCLQPSKIVPVSNSFMPISRYISTSRNEMRWIRNHPDFKKGLVIEKIPLDGDVWCIACKTMNGHKKSCLYNKNIERKIAVPIRTGHIPCMCVEKGTANKNCQYCNGSGQVLRPDAGDVNLDKLWVDMNNSVRNFIKNQEKKNDE